MLPWNKNLDVHAKVQTLKLQQLVGLVLLVISEATTVLEKECKGGEVRVVEVLSLFFWGEIVLPSPLSLFSQGMVIRSRVNIGNVKGVTIPGGMVDMCLGQVSVWNFPI